MDGVEPPHASSTEERHPSRLPARRAPRPRSPGATEVCRDWIGCRRARRGDLRTGANLIPRVGEAESELGKRVDAAYEKWTRAYCLQSDGADEFEAALRAQGPGKVAKCPSWSPGALSRRHTRAACYLRPGPARPWYELDKSRLCRGPGCARPMRITPLLRRSDMSIDFYMASFRRLQSTSHHRHNVWRVREAAPTEARAFGLHRRGRAARGAVQ